MFCVALVIGIIYAFDGLAVNAYRPAGMIQGTDIRIFPSLGKTLTACPVTSICVAASHHDISFTAIVILIIGTVFYTTF